MRELGDRKRTDFARRTLGTTSSITRRAIGWAAQGYSRNYVRVLTEGPEELTNYEVEVEASFVQGAAVVGQIIRTFDAARGAATGNPA